jgi:hypothetical protein
MDERVYDLRKGIDEGIEAAIAKRVAELRKDLQDVVQEVAGKRISNLRRDVERLVAEKSEGGVEELEKNVASAVGETTERRMADLRKDFAKVVGKAAEDRMGNLRKDVERIVGEVAEKRVSSIRKDVEKVVAEAGEQRVTELRKEVVSLVAEEIERAFSGRDAETPASSLLDSSLVSIHGSDSQTDILRALLDGAAHFASRVALFVVKGETATGWQARGLENDNAVKKASVQIASGLAARAISKRGPVNASAADFDSTFMKTIGAPADGHCLLLPLLVRDKVPALVYADSGTGAGRVDSAALQLLVRSAGFWLELVTLRKLAGETGEHEHEEEPVEVAVAAAAAASPATPATHSRTASTAASAKTAARPVSAEDEEVHKKARRFAKLLVDEIKLYNQSKVAEGRQHRDLYDRLKEDIEKSRASYDKRYGNTAAAGGDYFTQEVIRVLADNDASVLGSNFPQ